MAYGVKYRADYDTLETEDTPSITCRVEILQKDYTDAILPLLFGAEPVVQNYETDEAHPAIKGCSLTLTLINTGTLPISSFYSEESDTFKIKHYVGGTPTFDGFIVQEDCQEEMLDYLHELTLSANDNLGLLKDVALNATGLNTTYAYGTADFEATGSNEFTISLNTYVPVVDVPFTISGTSSYDGTYTPVSVTLVSGNWVVVVIGTIAGGSVESGILYVTQAMDFYGYNNLLSIIQACLVNTGLPDLFLTVYANIWEENQVETNSFLQQTYVNTQTFLDNADFKSCWDVLEDILNRFKLTLYQDNGQWVIVRLPALIYGTLNGIIYGPGYLPIGTATFGDPADALAFGFEEDHYPETAPLKTIIGAWKYDKETFNYEQPKYLLKNYDLLDLGSVAGSIIVGSNTVTDYFAPGFAGLTSAVYIRSITDTASGEEFGRMLVLKGSAGTPTLAVVGTPFEVGAGDRIKVEFSIQSNTSVPGPLFLEFVVQLTDGTLTYYADLLEGWTTVPGWTVTIPSGDDLNIEHTIEIFPPGRIPFSGRIDIFFPQVAGLFPSSETFFRDIRVTYTPVITESVKVVGQVQTQTQPPIIKANEDEEVFVDDSPRTSLKGAMTLVTYNGLLRVRTALWYSSFNPSVKQKIGEIITYDQLLEHRISRSKIEGTFYNIWTVKMLQTIRYINEGVDPFPKKFVFGSLEISYKSNFFDCTLYEIPYPEPDDLDNTYTFNYLYSIK